VERLGAAGKWVPLLLSLEKYASFGEMVGQRLNAVFLAPIYCGSFRLRVFVLEHYITSLKCE
jgi:hypothetical protein